MLELMEIVLNKMGSLIIGAVLLEYGISRWQERSFAKKTFGQFLCCFSEQGFPSVILFEARCMVKAATRKKL